MSSIPKANSTLMHSILLTLPRTASNLLTHILNLPAQPSIRAHPKSGYHFIDAFIYRYTHGFVGKSVAEWEEEERQKIKDMLQVSFDTWSEFVRTSEKEGKGTFLKEHVCFLIEPDYESRYEHSNAEKPSLRPDVTSQFLVAMEPLSENELQVSTKPDSTVPNPTIIPSDFWLNTMRPTFLIRHPAISFPSLLRAAFYTQNSMGAHPSCMVAKSECNYHFHRLLYDFYTSSPTLNRKSFTEGVEYPIILDADDFSEPTLLRKYAAAIGLDAHLVRFSWEPASQAELERTSAIEKRFKDTLLASSGVDPKKLRRAASLVLEDEKKKWKTEFGEEWANKLEELVKDALPDYEWLRQRRLKV